MKTRFIRTLVLLLVFEAINLHVFSQLNLSSNSICAPGKVAIISKPFKYYCDTCYKWYLYNYNSDITSPLYTGYNLDTIIINQPGEYQVILYEYYDSINYYDYYSNQIVAKGFPKKIVSFDNKPITQICPGYGIHLQPYPWEDNKYEWHLQNGIISYENSIYPIFDLPGNYNIKLITKNECGTDTLIETINVGTEGPIQKGNIFYSYVNISTCPNDPIYFTNYSDIYNYKSFIWNFGDGNTSTVTEAVHAYNSYGRYQVTVIATNECGLQFADTTYVNVVTISNINSNNINLYTNTNICPGEPTYFNLYGTTAGFILWDFGDGTKGSGINVKHAYKDTGTYHVQVIARDGCGNSALAEDEISVNYVYCSNHIEIGFSEDAEYESYYNLNKEITICPNTPLKFRNYSYGFKKFWWNFGDGSDTSSVKEPVHIYNNSNDTTFYPTFYAIKMNDDTISEWLTVNIKKNKFLHTSLGVVPDTICPGDQVYFYDNMFSYHGNTSKYKYDIIFGDGNSVTNITELDTFDVLARHAYNSGGSYNYTFIAKNECNADTLKGKIVVTNTPHKSSYYWGNSTIGDTSTFTKGGHEELWISNLIGDSIAFFRFYETESLKEYSLGYMNGLNDPTPTIVSKGRYQRYYGYNNKIILIDDDNFTPCQGASIYIINMCYDLLNDRTSLEFMPNSDEPCNLRWQVLMNKIFHLNKTTEGCGGGGTYNTLPDNSSPILPLGLMHGGAMCAGQGMNDWSNSLDSSLEFHLTVKVIDSTGNTANNDAFLALWYGHKQINTDPGQPDGYVQFTKSASGTIVTAHIPVNGYNEITCIPVWSKSGGLHQFMDGVGTDFKHYSISENGTLDDTSNPFALIFKPYNKIYINKDNNSKFIINNGQFEDHYVLLQNGNRISEGIFQWNISFLDIESITLNDTMLFSNCIEQESGMYYVSFNNNGITFYNESDNCTARYNILDANTFIPPFTCPNGYIYDESDNQCIPVCPAGFTFNGTQCIEIRKVEGYNPVCPGDTVTFSVGGGKTVVWNFGDGPATVNNRLAKHVYSSEGVYNAFANVSDGCNINEILYSKVIITSKKKPQFYLSSNIHTENNTLFVGDTISLMIYSYEHGIDNNKYTWKFGDGIIINNKKEVKHVYKNPGKYELSVEVTNGCGTTVEKHLVIVNPKPSISPVTANAGKDTAITGGASVILDASKSTGTGLSYQWFKLTNGGELTNVNSVNPTFTAPTGSNNADFIFLLKVTDNSSKSDSDFVVVKVVQKTGNYCDDAIPANIGVNNVHFLNGQYYKYFEFKAPQTGKLTISNCIDGNNGYYELTIYKNNCDSFIFNTYTNSGCITKDIIVNKDMTYYINWYSGTDFNFNLSFMPYAPTDFISFSIMNYQIGNTEIDYVNHKIKVYVRNDAPMNNLVPCFELLPGATVSAQSNTLTSCYNSLIFSSSPVPFQVQNGTYVNWDVTVIKLQTGGNYCNMASTLDKVPGIYLAQFQTSEDSQWYSYTAISDGILEINTSGLNANPGNNLNLYYYIDSCNPYYNYPEIINSNADNFIAFIRTEAGKKYYLQFYAIDTMNVLFKVSFKNCPAKAIADFTYNERNKALLVGTYNNLYTTADTTRFKFITDFGDGYILIDTFAYITHKYNVSGNIQAKQIVKDKTTGCSDTLIFNIFVKPPRAIFVSQILGSDDYGNGTQQSPYKTINHAISQTYNGDEIAVMPGTYNEALYLNDPVSLLIHSTKGPKNTVIGGVNDLFYIYADTSTHIKIEGFTLQNCTTVVNIYQGKVQIIGCIIRNAYNGIIIQNYSYGPQEILISHNLITNCENAVISNKPDAKTYILNNTIVKTYNGITIGNGTNFVQNNIIVNNNTGLQRTAGTVLNNYNNVWNNYRNYVNVTAGSNNISVNPLFVDTIFYTLQPTSPCIDAGDPSLPYDADGTISDIGYFSITKQGSINQNILLLKGWNIISLYAEPVNKDMLNIFNPIIIRNSLVKVQDEKGYAIEYNNNNWINNIGSLDIAKGYMVRVNKNDTLFINGNMVPIPFYINLKAGWNIIGYPSNISMNIENVFKNLIDNKTVLKVQDETGAAYEYINPIGYVNKIGNLKGGEGYKVRATKDIVITIAPQKSFEVNDNEEIIAPSYFRVNWNGNGINHMNFYIFAEGMLNIGDEIAVYDGNNCVGASVYNGTNSFVCLNASVDDPNTSITDGFIPGHTYKLVVYNNKVKREIDISELILYNGTKPVFEELATAVIGIKSGNEITTVNNNGDNLGECVPNPFSEETNITYKLKSTEDVKIEIYNMLGEKIKTIVEANMPSGIHTVKWNRTNSSGQKVPSGIYLYRMETSNYSCIKRMIIN
jgi:PKD repeat protein